MKMILLSIVLSVFLQIKLFFPVFRFEDMSHSNKYTVYRAGTEDSPIFGVTHNIDKGEIFYK